MKKYILYLSVNLSIREYQRFVGKNFVFRPKAYLEPSQTSTMELFWEDFVNYFRKKLQCRFLTLVLDTPLTWLLNDTKIYLSSTVFCIDDRMY